MKPTPPGWPRISSAVFYEDPAKAIDWLCEAFGFEVQMKVVGDGGRIEHSELVYGGGMVMVSGSRDAKPGYAYWRAPTQIDGFNTQCMMVYVDDVEAHCAQARKAGAKIVSEPKTSDYGEEYWADRTYECEDLGGHHWWFVQRMRNPKSKS
jgi:uncharacterized glyoxalase superfamily protein PhnB